MKKERQIFDKEKTAQVLFLACAVFSVVAVFAIVFFILYRSLPALGKVGLGNFLFGDTWEPRWEDKAENGLLAYGEIFGIRNMLLTSLIVTIGAVLLGGLLGVFTAVYVTYYCPNKIRAKKWKFLQKISPVGIFEQVVNLLSGIPSIIVGFFGLTAIIPVLRLLSPNGEGTGMLAAILVLAIMIMPTVSSLTKNSLQSLPKEYYEGSLALGNTKDQTVFRVMLPSAKKGILSALVLGVGRAIGETMAVLFVIGGASGKSPDSFFKPIGALTTAIANELGEAAFG
ncbi:MAG: phosphate ABC transporter permease subunit PstC, partial [Clostridia bacterium]|nr:phosphate ABC transporter permease subunit PstC [Clostridia bacterium]